MRKWAEIWGGDNSDFDFLPTKTGEKSPKNSQVKRERNKDLRYESALSPFLMRKKGWEEGRKVMKTESGEMGV